MFVDRSVFPAMPNVYITQAEEKMKKIVEKARQEFSTIRTSRVSPALVENLQVKCYDTSMPLSQLAVIRVIDARTLEIKPWDKTTIPDIEKAILASNLGLTPVNDGKSIKLTVPILTVERREEILKVIKKMAEDYKVLLRNVRRDTLALLKKAEKNKEITEDEYFDLEKVMQKTLDAYIENIDKLYAAKEKGVKEG
jgi:ribosome recycling factor